MHEILSRLDALRGDIRQAPSMTTSLADELLDILQTLVWRLLNERALTAGEPCDPDYVEEG